MAYNDDNNMVSSGAEEAGGETSGDDEGDSREDGDHGYNDNEDEDETRSEKEWNLQEELIFEKICLTLLSEQNWNGLAIESKRHL